MTQPKDMLVAFARIEADPNSPGRRCFFVGDQFVDDDHGEVVLGEPSPFESMAERINAAVDAREGALLGEAARLLLERWSWFFTRAHCDQLAADLVKLHPAGEYVRGDVACGLAFDLGIEKERTRGVWSVLLDDSLSKGTIDAGFARDLAEALGLPPPLMRVELTDDELHTECRRRGWHPEMGLAPRFVPSATDRPVYASEMEYRWLAQHLPPVLHPTRLPSDPEPPCSDTACSRWGTRHPGRPCDTRRARGVGGKR